MEKNNLIIIFLILFLSVISCSKDKVESSVGINGKAQKGPFINGSSVTLSELDADYTPTGKVFSTQILDNSGTFSLNNMSFSSDFVTLRVDGFYFNEVCGQPSSAQITLNGIVDISNTSNINLNVLTHLEKARVEYLLTAGMSLNNAKSQAQTEILNIFEISPTNGINSFESLDISGTSEGDAILIAISSILQGYRSESQLSDLMANIITDIRTDGVLNSTSLGSQLLAHAELLDTAQIKTNIEDRYNDLGISINVPSFGNYIVDFVNNSSFQINHTVIDYPSSVGNRPNLLDLNNTVYSSGMINPKSLSANIPNDCMELKIKISETSGACNSCLGHVLGSSQNWYIPSYGNNTISHEYTSTGLNTDLEILISPGTYLIEYFENSSGLPTKTKTITVN